jgi:uncharacterized protein (TIGR02996 family)
MSAEQGFLADIVAHPEDNAPRLVYADWLDDHDQPERAEFIRVQIELSRIDPTDDRYPELHLRQLQLLSEHEQQWLGPWADHLVHWRFQRGMLHEVTIQPEPFITGGADLFARHPVHTVAFVDDWGESLAPEAIARVLAAPHFALVRGLELSGCRPGEDMFGMFGGQVHTSVWLAGLAAAAQAKRLETISIPGGTRSGRGPIERGALAAFCSAKHLASLRCLNLSDVYDRDDLEQMPALCALLAGAKFAGGLRRFSLAHCLLSDAALDCLTASPGLRNLEAVDLTGGDTIGADALRAFLGSRPPRRLIELGLPYGLNLRELGDWPGLDAVQTLTLSGRHPTPRDIATDEWLALFRSPHLRPARLRVFAERVPDDALAELFRRDWLAELRALDLVVSMWGRPPDRDVLAMLLERDTPRLHEVGITGLAALSKRRLAAWPVLPRLTRFTIDREEEDFATWLLSRAPLTARVDRINLSGQCSTTAAVRALATSAGWRKSSWLRTITRLETRGWWNCCAGRAWAISRNWD